MKNSNFNRTDTNHFFKSKDNQNANHSFIKENDIIDLDNLIDIKKTFFPKKFLNFENNKKINFFDIEEKDHDKSWINNGQDEKKFNTKNCEKTNIYSNYKKSEISDTCLNKNKSKVYLNTNEIEEETKKIKNSSKNSLYDEEEEIKLIQEIIDSVTKDDFSIRKVNMKVNYENLSTDENQILLKNHNQNSCEKKLDLDKENNNNFSYNKISLDKTYNSIIKPNNIFILTNDLSNINHQLSNNKDLDSFNQQKNSEILRADNNKYKSLFEKSDNKKFCSNSINQNFHKFSNNNKYYLDYNYENQNKLCHLQPGKLSIYSNISKEKTFFSNYSFKSNKKFPNYSDKDIKCDTYTKNNENNVNLRTDSGLIFQNSCNIERNENNFSNSNTSNFDINKMIVDNLQNFPLNRIIKHNNLNRIQSDCFNNLYNTNKNCIITAPTGSGKTLLFELAMARVIKENFDQIENNFLNKSFKMIYIGPIKSLCQEKFNEWKIKYNLLNLIVVEATGDSDNLNINYLDQANIIVITPEKFDSLTRKWKNYPHLVSSITLIMIDEIHLLNEEIRGATLEAVITRLKLLSQMKIFRENKSYLYNYRTIAISATIPNIKELAEWLNVDKDGLRIYGDEYRPVKIERLVLGYNMAKNEFLFEKNLNYKLAELISRYSDDRPSLIFCQTQKGTVNAGLQLLEDMNKLYLNPLNAETKTNLNSIAGLVKDKQLSNLIRNGIAFHNASLSLEDRHLVEENFKKGFIRVICTTSTLAQGVNLPARLVIIKSTFCYKGPKIGYDEYNKMEIDQMVGRAGRPQYDNKGIAIIMTDKQNVDKYSDISEQSYYIKSHLKENLIEHINAEITQGTIVDIETGINWLKNTFMFVRMKNDLINKRAQVNKNNINNKLINNTINPLINNCKNEKLSESEKQIEDQLRNICLRIFKDLAFIQLIDLNNDNNCETKEGKELQLVKIKKLGEKMCKNYVLYETMKNIITIQDNSEEAILECLSNSLEFSKYRSKMEDRKILNNFNKDNNIKYKVKGVIDTYNKKAFLLLQAAFSNLPLEPWELRRQQSEIIQCCQRIINCIKQVFKQKDDVKGLVQILILKKALNQKMWCNSDIFLKQFPKIGDKIAKNLSRGGINNFEKLINENPRKIEMLASKNAPFGSVLIDLAKSIPKLELRFEIFRNNTYKNRNQNNYKITLYTKLFFKKLINQEDFDPYTCYFILVSSNKNKIVFKKKIKPNFNEKEILFNIYNGINPEIFPITIYIICEKFVGLDSSVIIENERDSIGTISNILNLNNKTFHDYKNISINKTSSNLLINTANDYSINNKSKIKINPNNANNSKKKNSISEFSNSITGNIIDKNNIFLNINQNNFQQEFEIDDQELDFMVTQIIEENNLEIKKSNVTNFRNLNEKLLDENKKSKIKKKKKEIKKIEKDPKTSDLMILLNNMKNNEKTKKIDISNNIPFSTNISNKDINKTEKLDFNAKDLENENKLISKQKIYEKNKKLEYLNDFWENNNNHNLKNLKSDEFCNNNYSFNHFVNKKDFNNINICDNSIGEYFYITSETDKNQKKISKKNDTKFLINFDDFI